MKNFKTTAIGVLQLLGAISFSAFKLANGMSFSDAEAGMVFLALSSGFKGLVTADSKKE